MASAYLLEQGDEAAKLAVDAHQEELFFPAEDHLWNDAGVILIQETQRPATTTTTTTTTTGETRM